MATLNGSSNPSTKHSNSRSSNIFSSLKNKLLSNNPTSAALTMSDSEWKRKVNDQHYKNLRKKLESNARSRFPIIGANAFDITDVTNLNGNAQQQTANGANGRGFHVTREQGDMKADSNQANNRSFCYSIPNYSFSEFGQPLNSNEFHMHHYDNEPSLPSINPLNDSYLLQPSQVEPESPTVTLRSAPTSFNETGVRIIFKIPPVVFLPKSVPCGPRRTSIRSISKLSKSTPLDVPKNIPSITTPIEGS